MNYFVYVLQSDKNGRFYIGYSTDPKRCVEQHNEGWTRSTKMRGNWKIVYMEEYKSKSEALRREREIKSRKSHEFIERMIHAEGRPVCPAPKIWLVANPLNCPSRIPS